MAGVPYLRSPFGVAKRLKLSSSKLVYLQPAQRATFIRDFDMLREAGYDPNELASVVKQRGLQLPGEKPPVPPEAAETLENLRLPRSVQAAYLRPLRRAAQYGVPCCDLQLRSYSVRNVEFMADFAMRAAYYLNLPAKGPVPLPRITERWTVPRANFIFKKSQENFERITLRRLIQIQDGHPLVVRTWLAYLEKHAYHGVGMKANVWEFESLDGSDRDELRAEEKEFLDLSSDVTTAKNDLSLPQADMVVGSKEGNAPSVVLNQ